MKRLGLLLLQLSSFALVAGCGGGGSASQATSVATSQSTTQIGPNGGIVTLPTSEQVVVPAGALTKDTSVTLKSLTASILPAGNGYSSAASPLSLIVDSSAVTSSASFAIKGPYTGQIDTADPSAFYALVADSTGNIQTLNNLSTTPQIELDPLSHTYTIHLDYQATRSRLRRAARVTVKAGRETISDALRIELDAHFPISAETNPQIRTFLFRTGAATLDQVRQADQRSDSDAISGECWTPLDSSNYTDGTHRRVAILVHGISNRINNMTALAYYLSHLRDSSGTPYYDAVWGIDHDWQGSIGPRGDELAVFINSKFGSAQSKADIFAHSQGTLVARYAMEVSGGNAKAHVNRVYLFAPMNKGIPIGLANAIRIGSTAFGYPFGFVGVKEMLREPNEWYKNYWYLLDRLIDDNTQGGVPYYVLTGGHPSTYINGEMSTWYGSEDHDGIVPWDSSKYIPPSHSNVWYELPAPEYSVHFDLNHGEVVGRFVGSTTVLNLDDPNFANGNSNLFMKSVLENAGTEPTIVGDGAPDPSLFISCYSKGENASLLGYPTSAVIPTGTSAVSGATGYYQSFSSGAIEVKGNSAFAVCGSAYTEWGTTHYVAGSLGFPTGDYIATGASAVSGRTGHYQTFEGGAIEELGENCYVVVSSIYQQWGAKHYAAGSLGFPVGDAYPWQGGFRQDFEGGFLTQ